MEFPGPKTAELIRPHLQKSLRVRLLIYLLVSIGVLGFVVYNSFVNLVSPIFAAGGVAIGLGLGYIVSRMHKISWSQEASQVVARMDFFGGAILVLYILFEVFRSKIVGRFVAEAHVTVTSFSLLAGIMYGRVLGIRGTIVKVLKEQDLLA